MNFTRARSVYKRFTIIRSDRATKGFITGESIVASTRIRAGDQTKRNTIDAIACATVDLMQLAVIELHGRTIKFAYKMRLKVSASVRAA